MTNIPNDLLDLRQLFYFSVVAEELNLHRAAKRLFISQPPLSRHIQQLEQRLGLALFTRHTRGLQLTAEGARALATIRPLLDLSGNVAAQLREQVSACGQRLVIGFTTAFEQGIFADAEARLHALHGAHADIRRASSPRLVREVKRGRIDAAFVALPLETQGLEVATTGYEETYVAALPASWGITHTPVTFADLHGKPLFWFRREQNPAFYDFARSVFTQAEFMPLLQEEPAEHDVLLARIAAGEGAGVLPSSFAVVQRKGVVYTPLSQAEHLRLQLGIVTLAAKAHLRDELLPFFRPTAHKSST